MLLAQITDTHLLYQGQDTPLALERADKLVRVVDTINQLPIPPAAIVHTGDMVNFAPKGAEEENSYELAFEILSQLKAPFYPTVGNRDSRPDLIAQFLAPDLLPANADFCQYRIKLKKADLISVDTKSATRIGTSCEPRLAQLKELLLQDTDKPVFVFLHHPPARVETIRNPLQFESIERANAVVDLLNGYDNIVRILCGHTHRSDMLDMGHHAASTSSSIATDVRLDRYPDQFNDEPVFQLHKLQGDHSVTSMSHFAISSRANAT
ncbi:MAG: hypothetical protein GY927_04580 [bacterium]|nr:hypothetical protein [bacterium]